MKQLELDLGLQPIQRWLKDWNKKPPQRPAVHRAGEGEELMLVPSKSCADQVLRHASDCRHGTPEQHQEAFCNGDGRNREQASRNQHTSSQG